jgi:hypothetical protein
MKLLEVGKTLVDHGANSYPIWRPGRIWIRNCFMKLLGVGKTLIDNGAQIIVERDTISYNEGLHEELAYTAEWWVSLM